MEKLRLLRLIREEAQERLRDPEQRWALRMKFLQQVRSYMGVPYNRKYHQPGTVEYESPLFLDCCGLVRQAMRDLWEDFGFVLGPGNQSYQYDTLPITLDRVEDMRPGDLVFISGTYFSPNKKRQIHDIVHVEVWLGEGDRTVGARWHRETVQEFESYQFVSSSYGNMQYHFKSIETWLSGTCVSHCRDHRWQDLDGRCNGKSIFNPDHLAQQTMMSSESREESSNQREAGVQGTQEEPGCKGIQSNSRKKPGMTDNICSNTAAPNNTEDMTSNLNQERDEKQEVAVAEERLSTRTQLSPLEQEGAKLIQADAGGPVSVGRSLDERYLTGLRRRSPSRFQRRELFLTMCGRDKVRGLEDSRGPGPVFYVGGGNGASIVASYCESLGWQRIYDKTRDDYILKWCETKSKIAYYNFREGEQLLYQIPNNKVLTTKIGLLCSLREYDRISSKVNHSRGLSRKLRMDEFFPVTFRMDIKKEKDEFFAQLKAVGNKTEIWICKPTGLNQGRGIFLLRTEEEISAFQTRLQISEDSMSSRKLPFRLPQARIVQRYLESPLLLKGRKFDVRSYFLIACTTPYMVFFRHGYVRLTCDLYDPKSNNLSAHLTNQYMQKKNPLYSVLKEETVWSMERFNAYVNEQFREAKGLPQDWVLGAFARRMQAIITQCFLAVKAKLECKLGLFDLIGCDFMIDEDFKVWLIEMNSNPALHTNCQVLKDVVPSTVAETLDLTLEIFHKCRNGLKLLPLVSQRDFVLLYGGHSTPVYRSRTAGPLRTAHPKSFGTPKPITRTPKAASVAGSVEKSGCSPAVRATPNQPSTAVETSRSMTTMTPRSSNAESTRSAIAESPRTTNAETPRSTNAETPTCSNAETLRSPNAETHRSTNPETLKSPNAETTRSSNAEATSNSNAETPRSSNTETPRFSNAETSKSTNAEIPRSSNAETCSTNNAENPSTTSTERPSTTNTEIISTTNTETPLVVNAPDIRKTCQFHPKPVVSRVEPYVSKHTLEQPSVPSELNPPATSYRVRGSIVSRSNPTLTSQSDYFIYRPRSKDQRLNSIQKHIPSPRPSQEQSSPLMCVNLNESCSEEEGDKKE